jgi:hypothetical protein
MKNNRHCLAYKGAQYCLILGNTVHLFEEKVPGYTSYYAKQVYIPQYNMNYYDYKMFYVNSEGKIYHWITQRQQVPPTQIDLNIYKRY